jgi:hypothetical protein
MTPSDHLKHIEGFRRLAQTMASACISLGAFSLALLVYTRNSPSGAFVPPYQWLWLLQFVGISLIFCSAMCTDWIVDSFTAEEWEAARTVSPELRWKNWHIGNQVSERLSLFSTGYFLFSLANCLLVGAMVYYFWVGTKNIFLFMAVATVLPGVLLAKMLTQTLLPSKVISTIIFVLLLLVYGFLSFTFGHASP